MAGVRPQPVVLLSCTFVMISIISSSSPQEGAVTSTDTAEPIQQVECQHTRRDLLTLTLIETGNMTYVRTARVDNSACTGNMTLSTCFFDYVTVRVKAVIVGAESAEIRPLECTAHVFENSVTVQKLVGKINITVGVVTDITVSSSTQSAGLYTTFTATMPTAAFCFAADRTVGLTGAREKSQNRTAKESTAGSVETKSRTCVAVGPPHAAFTVLVIFTVIFLIIAVVLVSVIYKRGYASSLCHVTGRCWSQTSFQPQEEESATPTLCDNSVTRHTSLRLPPPSTPAPLAPSSSHVMHYQQPLSGAGEDLWQCQTSCNEVDTNTSYKRASAPRDQQTASQTVGRKTDDDNTIDPSA